MKDVNNRGSCGGMWGERLGGVGMWRLSVFSVQFPCKPKIALKNEVYF